MRRFSILLGPILSVLMVPLFAWAQSSDSLWYLIGSQIRPIVNTYGLRLPSLTNCNGVATDAEGDFGCGSGGGGGVSTGGVLQLGDSRYVNVSGDTMTGNLIIKAGFSGSRVFAGTLSGAGLTTCTSSGQSLQWNATTQKFTCANINGRFAGVTSTVHSGSVVRSGNKGYTAARVICAQNFPGSHFCSAEELMNTGQRQNITSLYASVADAWVANGPPGFTANSNDCRGWQDATASYLGPWWRFSGSTVGVGFVTNCSTTKPLACCY